MDKGCAMIPRERGPDIGLPPPKTKELKYRVRTWMVEKSLLEKNPQWLTSGRVAWSGPTWGEENVEESQGKSKRKANLFIEREGEASSRKAARLELEAPTVDNANQFGELDVFFGTSCSSEAADASSPVG